MVLRSYTTNMLSLWVAVGSSPGELREGRGHLGAGRRIEDSSRVRGLRGSKEWGKLGNKSEEGKFRGGEAL